MRPTALAASALAGLLAVSLAGTAIAAPRATPSKDALGGTGDDQGAAAFFFGSGFEASEGFAVGPLEPQNGWTATGVNLPWASVSSANPFTGTQHLRAINNPAAGAGATHVLLSPVNAQPANSPSTVYCKVNISNDGGADYSIIGQAPSQMFITWRVLFSYSDAVGTGPGTIFILDNIGMVIQFVDTGVLWDENVYRELRVDFNPMGGAIDYYYNGVPIYTGNIVAGTAVEQVGAVTDNFQLAGETADIDAISVQSVGEPPVGVQQATWTQIKAMMR
jgi:hypothetical protein